MPQYRFTNTQALVYVDRSLVVEPGDLVDWPDGAPEDGHWEPAPATGKTPAKKAPVTDASKNEEV
jgi:hypothetical protein